MKFEEKLNQLISETDVPDQLSPRNIALMLKAQSHTANKAESKKHPAIHMNRAAGTTQPAAGVESSKDSIKIHKRGILARSGGALAACVALAFGVTALIKVSAPTGFVETSDGIVEASDYSYVYKAIQDVFVKNGTGVEEFPDASTTTPPPPVTSAVQQPPSVAPAQNVAPSLEKAPAATRYDVTAEEMEGVLKADIVKTDGKNLYYIANGALYVVSIDGGKMTLLSRIARADSTALEAFLLGNRLAVISNNTVQVPYEYNPGPESETASSGSGQPDGTLNGENDSEDVLAPGSDASSSETVSLDSGDSPSESSGDSASALESGEPQDSQDILASGPPVSGSETPVPETSAPSPEDSPGENNTANVPTTISQSNAVVEIYDLTDPAAPVLAATYKQNGAYVSAQMMDNALYLVTNYAKYQTKPLEKQSDLDNYVPAYYLGDQKFYVDAKDIGIPSKASSTSYTIVSGLDLNNAASPLTSIKAVLGSGKYSHASKNRIYVAGPVPGSKEKDCTSITSFQVGGGSVTYSANAVVEGTVAGPNAMSEYDGSFRIATTTTDKSGKHYSSVYVLGTDLKLLGSISNLSAAQTVEDVRFSKDTAYLVINGDSGSIAVSLADKTAPKLLDKSSSLNAGTLFKYSDARLLGLGEEVDESGKVIGIKVSMFDSSTLQELSSATVSGGLSDSFGSRLVQRGGVLMDAGQGIVGIPTVSRGEYGSKNLYTVFSYQDSQGFVKRGTLEYNDVDNISDFNRGVIVDDVLYALSRTRVVSAQLSDLKVIEALSLK